MLLRIERVRAFCISSNVDTGYFVFFTRKHDPHQDLIVLRADKLLVTSRSK